MLLSPVLLGYRCIVAYACLKNRQYLRTLLVFHTSHVSWLFTSHAALLLPKHSCCESTPVAKALLLRKHSCCKKKVKHVARRITTESYKETQWLACMSSKRKLEQEIIEGTHAQETPAYQRRPTTLHEVQGRNSPIRTLYMQVAKIPPTHHTTPCATIAPADKPARHPHCGRNRNRPSAHTTKRETPEELPRAQKHV